MPSADSTPRLRVFSIRQKVLLGFILAIVGVGVLTVVTYRSTQGFIDTARWVAHTRMVIENQEMLLRHVMEAESAARGYLLTGDEAFLQWYRTAGENARAAAAQLEEELKDDSGQSSRLSRIRREIAKKLRILDETIEVRRTGGTDAAIRRFSGSDGRASMKRVRSQIADFEEAELRLLHQRSGLAHMIARTTLFVVLLGSAFTIALLVIAVTMILRDITARHRAEELLAQERNLLRNLIDTIPEQIFVKDLLGRYILDNAGHRKFLGIDSLGDIVGKTVFSFFPQELAALYHADDQAALQSGQPILNREEPAVTGDGKLTWLSTTKVPLAGVGGNLIGLVCVSSDISERKAAEEKLRVFAAQLERSNDELRDFASVASHDLQEPLRKIQAFSDRLRAKCNDSLCDQGRDYLDRIQNAAGRMQTLIQDLLTLSHISSKAQPFVETDLAAIVRGVLSDLEVRIEQSAAKVEVGFLPVIQADPLQMRQLFQNLLSNALKFQKPGQKPEIVISSKILEVQDHQLAGAGPGDRVCQIMVKDNGIGFEEQYVEQIFALFQRLHSRGEYEGTGIGLAVCRKIAHRHGGTIVAKSAKDEGATFIVMLPVEQKNNP